MSVLVKGPKDAYYRSNRKFAQLSEGESFGQMRSVAVDSRGWVFVGHRPLLYGTLPPVAVFRPDGTYSHGWGSGVFQGIHNLHISNDEVFVVDQDSHRVFKFSVNGDHLLTIGSGVPAFEEAFNNPTGVAVGPDGTIFVSDGDSNTRVHAFSAAGRHLHSWGSPGKAVGELTSPHSIAVGPDGLVYVGDRDASRIVVFSPEGEHIREWTDVLHRPTDLWFDGSGVLWVADLVVRVHQYDAFGAVLGRAHGALPLHSLCGDAEGNLFLVGELPNVEKWELIDAEEAARDASAVGR